MTPILDAIGTTLENGITAKNLLVAEEGVGSDLIPSVFGFDAWGQPIGYAALIERSDGISSIEPLVQAALVMRRAWGCDIVALLVEGYTAPASDDTRTLIERYPTDPDVRECLTVHAASSSGTVCSAIHPYTVTVGRKVVWFDREIDERGRPHDPLGSALADVLSSTTHEPWVWTFEDGFFALSELGFVAVGDDQGWDTN